jgi:2-oxoglutarate ferredoxin oxidoreductase subunit delta
MSPTAPPPVAQHLVSSNPRAIAIGNLKEWTEGQLSRRPISPPTALKLRDVDILVLEDRCKGCSFCIEFCPKDVLEESKKLNVRGVHPPQVKDIELCVGCGICEELCPDFAIFMVDKEERK